MRRLLSLCCLLLGSAQAAPLRLVTHDLPPYSFAKSNGSAEGVAVRPVQCALDRMGLPYNISFVPWKRAQIMVRTGEADAFFAASKSPERDRYATMSAMVAPQEWRWFLLRDNPSDPRSAEFRSRSTVGSFIGANMLDWLKANGYRVEATPATNLQLLRMLLGKRVDAILANHLVMADLLQENDATQKVRSELQENKPLGVYFSHSFLASQPQDFMARFNAALTACPH